MIIVKIWGQIDRNMSNLVDVELAQLKDDNEPVIVLINSEGGILSDAIAICNLLNAVPNKKITIAIGACASAAAMIFACGNTRYVAKDAQYMIHQPLVNPGDGYLNYTENGRIQTGLKKSLALYKKYITKNTTIPKKVLDIAFKQGLDVEITPKDCIKYNIATHNFTTWNKLYKNENINLSEERVLNFDIEPQTSETEEN